MWRDSSAVLQDLLSRHHCPEISVSYTCGHCQEAEVALPAVLQKKEGRLGGRTAAQVLKAQCKRCERGRVNGPPNAPQGADDDAVPQFRIEIPLGRCAECQRLKLPEEQCGERDALRCGGVLIDLTSAREKLEDAVPIAVGARQLLQWVQLPLQAKPQRIMLMSARPDMPGGDLACTVVEKVRKATGWSPFVLALLAWTLGCVAYGFNQKPENPSLNPDLLYEQFQRRIEDIPVPQSSPQYQQYRQYYLRQYEEHLQEYSVMNMQWQQNRPLFNWQAFVQGMGVGLLVFSAALAFCEYHYGTISCWMELGEELWYVWQDRWSKWWDPLGDSQKMERFLQEMGEEPKKPEAPLVEAAAVSARQASAQSKMSSPSSTPTVAPPREPKIDKDVAASKDKEAETSGGARSGRPAAHSEISPEPHREPSPEHAPEKVAAAKRSSPTPPAVAPQQPAASEPCEGGSPEPARQAARAVPPLQQQPPQPQLQQPTQPPQPPQSTIGQTWEAQDLPGTSSMPQSRTSGRSGQDVAGSNVRERLRRKVIERKVAEPPKAARKAPRAEEATRRERAADSRSELLREAEELLCQLEAESLLKQLAEEEERKRSSAQKKRAKHKADRVGKGAELGQEGDPGRRDGEQQQEASGESPFDEAVKADSGPRDAEAVTTSTCSESGGDDSAEPEEAPTDASPPPAEAAESLPSIEPEEVPVLPAEREEDISIPTEFLEEPAWSEPREAEVVETVVTKGRRRQRHRASRQSQAAQNEPVPKVVTGGAPASSAPRAAPRNLTLLTAKQERLSAAAAPALSTPEGRGGALRVRNTFLELPEEEEEVVHTDSRVRARSAPCRLTADPSKEDCAERATVGEAPATPPATPVVQATQCERRASARATPEKSAVVSFRRLEAERLRREAERRERRDPKRPGVWDDPPRASRPSQPLAPTTRSTNIAAAAAKDAPKPKLMERRDKNCPGVWDDLPPRTQSGPLLSAQKPSPKAKCTTPLGAVLSKEAGAAAGASILQVLRGGEPDTKEEEEETCKQEEVGVPVEASESDKQEEAATPAKSVALRADAPEFVPAMSCASVEPMPDQELGQALVPVVFVVGPDQQMMPMQVLHVPCDMPLPDGAQIMGQIGPVPMVDGMQEQAVPMMQPSPMIGSLPEEDLPATPCSGQATPLMQINPSEGMLSPQDIVAHNMELLRQKLQCTELLCQEENVTASDYTIEAS